MAESPKWLGFRENESPLTIPDVQPLTLHQIQKSIYTIVDNDPAKYDLLSELKEKNTDIYDQSPSIGVVLDGRSQQLNQGYLGDLVEGSIVISALRQDNKHVVVFTPHADLFTGSTDNGIEIVTIPSDSEPTGLWPPSQDFKQIVAASFPELPVLLPINANMPVLAKIQTDGSVANQASINTITNIIRRTNIAIDLRMAVKTWAKAGLNQSQALQIMCHLIGVSNAAQWNRFPEPFIEPGEKAQGFADAVIQLYSCLPNERRNPLNGVPIFIHPGVAAEKSKFENKFYPEEKWKTVLELAYSQGLNEVINPLIFLTPTDEQQAAITTRLYDYAKSLGINTTQVPLREVQKELGWSLGTFAAFLQRLSQANGIIIGCDSMPAAHLGPALGMESVVVGNRVYDPIFFSPPDHACVVLPKKGIRAQDIPPEHVVMALKATLQKVQKR